MALSTLYAADGKRWWRVQAIGNTVVTEYGQCVGGKTVRQERVVVGKNVGKKNETSAEQQAEKEAKARWIKKRDSGFRESQEQQPTNAVFLPMLAQSFTVRSKDIVFPCRVQPKLDGVRAVFHDGALWSRLGKPIIRLDHIVDELVDVQLALDGELYSDVLSFQEIVSAIKKKSSKSDAIKYIVYDAIIEHVGFDERLERVASAVDGLKHTQVLETKTCDSLAAVDAHLDKFVAEGYEGLIVRNCKGIYAVNKRSKDLQKVKRFADAEFEIVGFTDGSGSEKGCILFSCVTKEGKTFSVRPMGDHAERKQMFANGESFIGKRLSVRFQELTDGGIPRFPVGVTVRDYE